VDEQGVGWTRRVDVKGLTERRQRPSSIRDEKSVAGRRIERQGVVEIRKTRTSSRGRRVLLLASYVNRLCAHKSTKSEFRRRVMLKCFEKKNRRNLVDNTV
jgi:hypothetical protein